MFILPVEVGMSNSQGPVESSPQQGDGRLELFVNMADGGAASGIPLTRSVRGTLLSGFVVSSKEYFEGFGAEFADSAAGAIAMKGYPEAANLIRETIKKSSTVPGDAGHEIKADDPVSFLHMKDVHIMQPGAHVQVGSLTGWWRIPMDGIDCFTLGAVSADR